MWCLPSSRPVYGRRDVLWINIVVDTSDYTVGNQWCISNHAGMHFPVWWPMFTAQTSHPPSDGIWRHFCFWCLPDKCDSGVWINLKDAVIRGSAHSGAFLTLHPLLAPMDLYRHPYVIGQLRKGPSNRPVTALFAFFKGWSVRGLAVGSLGPWETQTPFVDVRDIIWLNATTILKLE